jgi:hypothetical protein
MYSRGVIYLQQKNGNIIFAWNKRTKIDIDHFVEFNRVLNVNVEGIGRCENES